MIDQESLNNLNHMKKILRIEIDKVIMKKDQDLAYHEYWLNLVNIFESIRSNIDIANDPIQYIKDRDKE